MGTRAYHGMVENITDPKGLGRVRFRIPTFGEAIGSRQKQGDISPWCHPMAPFAGPSYGLYIEPHVGDEGVIMQLASGDWVVLGYHWSGRVSPPTEGDADNRVFKTPAGHLLQFDDAGDITLRSSGGASVLLKANGDIELNAADGKVVTTAHICAYTGGPHPQGSSTVKADK